MNFNFNIKDMPEAAGPSISIDMAPDSWRSSPFWGGIH